MILRGGERRGSPTRAVYAGRRLFVGTLRDFLAGKEETGLTRPILE